MQYTNYASYLPAPNAPLEVATAPLPSADSLADDEIIIKNHAVAINPVDWKVRDAPPENNRFGVKYPFILGEDVAGEVLHVGAKVKGFQKGDRVLAHAIGLSVGDSAYGGYQLYVKLNTAVVSKIPNGLAYTSAAVLPLSVSTAAAGLYMTSALGLALPPAPSAGAGATADKKRGTLVLWGGSSSVGSSVVQLAAASGYDVVATASPSNYGYVKGLGASYVLDYHNPDVVGILALLLRGLGSRVVGVYDAIGTLTTVGQSAGVLGALGGGRVASVGALPEPGSVGKGVEVVRVGSTGIVSTEPAVARRVWGEFLPAALGEDRFRAAPRETVVGTGLYYVQGALDLNKRGVSAAKVVVEL